MFRRHHGFLGCIMSRNDDWGYVYTIWRDLEAIAELERSEDYSKTVEAILAADLLQEPQSTTIQVVHLSDLDRVKDV